MYGMQTDKQFISTLEEEIRRNGAMQLLISDKAQVEISKLVEGLLRALCIDSWQSEPEHQHQNFAERVWGAVKHSINKLMNRYGIPASRWFIVAKYVAYVWNRMSLKSLKDRTPHEQVHGTTPDISILMQFHIWEPVYYAINEKAPFPSETNEAFGFFAGFSEHVGNAFCFEIIDAETEVQVDRSLVRTATDPELANIRALKGSVPEVKPHEDEQEYVRFARDQDREDGKPDVVIDVEELLGRTFLMPPEEDGTQHRAKIVGEVIDEENPTDKFFNGLAKNNDLRRFRVSVNDGEYEEILTYRDFCELIENEDGKDAIWKFKAIVGHNPKVLKSDPNYKNDDFNLLIEWETGEKTWEPLKVIMQDDPYLVALYARDNDLLGRKRFSRLRRLVKNEKKLTRMINQSKLRSFRTAKRYKYGYEVPKDWSDAMRLDQELGGHKWDDAVGVEMNQIDEYDTFEDLGHKDTAKIPQGFRKIKAHLVFDVKHDGRFKARFVANGNMTAIPVESVYSSVVSLRALRLTVFLSELNDLELWGADVGNAYLEAKTNEKVYIIAGPEFGQRKDHVLIIRKSLYGLKSSGKCWHDRFAEVLREMGFVPCKMEPDVWMRDRGDHYEYIAVYVDDLAIASKDPQSIIDVFTSKYGFKLKGVGPLKFHLGCDFYRDEDGVLCMAPKKYIDRMVKAYERMFGEKPKQNVLSPLEKGDHPELDTSEELGVDDIAKYQSLIGALQWCISLGRIDVATAVATMSSFRAAPRVGHMKRVKRIYGYLTKMKHAVLRFRTGEPDFSDLVDAPVEWATSVYGDVKEEIPKDVPKALGRSVVTYSYFDANLYHDLLTGRAMTGVLHFVNQTLYDWHTKKQATVETATYGSEFSAGRTCVEGVMDMRLTLRYMGVPIEGRTRIFGDNQSMVITSTIPFSAIKKRHNALAIHRVRECMASNAMSLYHIPGDKNPADILSKHWGYSQVYPLLRPILFFRGDTANCVLEVVKDPEDDNTRS
jgi:hypothetical protein